MKKRWHRMSVIELWKKYYRSPAFWGVVPEKTETIVAPQNLQAWPLVRREPWLARFVAFLRRFLHCFSAF
jgi:hypothetical protein